MNVKKEDESLKNWVERNRDELKLIAEHGSNKSIRCQAKAMLEVGLDKNDHAI